ncbi:MAG TPA: hypothetical protein VLX68_12235 [Chitinivibrionales bacterium]|nr:hypothetical protein [Chitinivibrionales bacterium]
MGAIKARMIEQAMSQYNDIRPTALRYSFSDCFTVSGDKIMFWFNTGDNSTHMLVEYTNQEQKTVIAE